MASRRFAYTCGILIAAVLIVVSGCISGSSHNSGLPGFTADVGYRVKFDPLAHPNPIVPLPIDVSTALEEAAHTGRRLNIRHTAPTNFEAEIREEINRLNGFGTFAPVLVSFDGPIDLDTVGPETIKLINIDQTSSRFGQEVPLDLPLDWNLSYYPVEIAPWAFPPHHPHVLARQMLYDPEYQGKVGSEEYVDFYERETNTLTLRVIEPMDQETEYMVVLTKGLMGEDGNPVRSPFVEPVHAVQQLDYLRMLPVLQEKGISPDQIAFAWTFTTQTTTRDLEVISDGIRGIGPMAYLPEKYPPVFTQVADLETDLDKLFCNRLGDNPCRDNTYILQAELLDPFMGLLDTEGAESLIRAAGILFVNVDLGFDSRLVVDMDAIDYFVFGRYQTPDFRMSGSDTFQMNYRTGEAWTQAEEIPWMIAIPKPSPEHQAPFPVALHVHGIPALRWQIITEANAWAEKGYATVAVTAPMHEPIASVEDVKIMIRSIVSTAAAASCDDSSDEACMQEGRDKVQGLLDGLGKGAIEVVSCMLFGKCGAVEGGFDEALEVLVTSGFFAQLLVEGRAKDLDGDGNTDHGAIFTADLFKSRDRIRQHMVEQIQMAQLLKGLEQALVPPAVADPDAADYEELKQNLLAGDFNLDGVLDLGGTKAYAPYKEGQMPSVVIGEQQYVRTGLSFGGISGSILAAIEPDIQTYAISVPGGGLTDIMTRMDLHHVSDAIYHQVLGPVVVIEPAFEIIEGAAEEPLEADGSHAMKISFIRRGKVDEVRFGDKPASLWSNTIVVEPFDFVLPVGGWLNIVNEENGERAVVTHADLWEENPMCFGESIFLQGVDITGKFGCFSAGVASDIGDSIVITVQNASGEVVEQMVTKAVTKGMGKNRNTSDFRYFINLGQIAMEPADPINYARHWFLEPLGGEGTGRAKHPVKNLMITGVPGDMFVAFHSQIALIRAAGLFGSESNRCDAYPRTLAECGGGWEDVQKDCDCINLYYRDNFAMIGNHTVEAPRFDLDGFADGVSSACNPHSVPPVDNRELGAGWSYVRFPYSNVNCEHNYIERINRGMHWLMASFYNTEITTNWSKYYQNQMAEYFLTEGFANDPALDIDCSCDAFRGKETCRFLP